MPTLVFVEHHEGEAAKGSLGVLAKAASLGDEVAAVVLGEDVRGVAEGLGAYGASRVHVGDDPALAAPLPAAARRRPREARRARAGTTPCSSRRASSLPTSRPGSPPVSARG